MNRMRSVQAAFVVSILFAAVGCGSSTVISGSVTYEGKPVEKGSITFLPADGKGPSDGGEIVDGRYEVELQSPGKKIVQIIGTKDVPFARSSEEMARMAEEAKKQGNTSGLIDPADIVPPDAIGNNAEIEVASGKQTHNFDLKKPATRRTR